MAKNHTYVLGINAYDHDVSACLLRDGEIAFAINKERLTRKKHDGGFYQKVVDYCLAAEGISFDDIDLVVRNCYVLPVEDLELRMLSQYVPEVMDDQERIQAKHNPLYLSKSNKVMTVSHHLAHAYSAFAACPFNEGVVMVVDGVGNYSSDAVEPGQQTDNIDPLARESESYYRFEGCRLETLKKIWLKRPFAIISVICAILWSGASPSGNKGKRQRLLFSQEPSPHQPSPTIEPTCNKRSISNQTRSIVV